MRSEVFTDYVRSLDPSGEPPSAESFQGVWRALEGALISELQRRGLWHHPPSYLGIYGFGSWRERPSDEGGSGALEELLAACYSHIFIRRLGGLKAQLRVKDSIDGLVVLGIRNVLHDTQKRHDPLGFRVFEVLRSAVRAAIDAGELRVVAGDRRIRNDTVLGWDDGAQATDDAGELDALLAGWLDTLLPDLVTARGAARRAVTAELQGRLATLRDHGFEAVRFRQLVDPLKNGARGRWGALLEPPAEEKGLEIDGGEKPVVVRLVAPDRRAEERDSFEKLVTCVTESVDAVAGAAGSHLSTLWEFLATGAAEKAPGGALTLGDGRPSARKLSRHLRIPREKIAGLFETLGALVEACRSASSGQPPVSPLRRTGGRDAGTRGETDTGRRAR